MAESLPLRRTRSLTVLGNVQYEEFTQKYNAKLLDAKRNIDSIIMEVEENPVMSLGDASQLKTNLTVNMEQYDKISADFQAYLKSQRTSVSAQQEAVHRQMASYVHERYATAIEKLSRFMPKSESVKSFRSNKPSECSSHVSSVVLKHTAMLADAKTRLKYAEKEAELMRREAALQADLTVLKVKREMDAAQSSLTAIKRVLDFSTQEIDDNYTDVCDSYHKSTGHRREQFYPPSTHSVTENIAPVIRSNHDPPELVHTPTQVRNEHYVRERCNTNKGQNVNYPVGAHSPTRSQSNTVSPRIRDPDNKKLSCSDLNPHAPPFIGAEAAETPARTNCNTHLNVESTDIPQQGSMDSAQAELVKFVIKKDLIPSRFMKYDDNPMTYMAWKMSFKNICCELNVTPREELDLLVRWLGPDSSKQASTIRACNAHDANIAKDKIWERLEQRFGSPEVVESALKRRLTNFPTLTRHDNKHLYDLVDLVSEIASVKSQPPYSLVFGYYDSSTGINPIVAKLPPNLQDRWTLEATKYKRREEVAYPPFSFFVKFIKDIAEMKNDPSFHYNAPNEVKVNHRQSRGAQTGLTILNRKTEVTRDVGTSASDLSCPYHTTLKRSLPHTLNECVAFRRKSLDDRKKFIRENGFCFKCCNNKKHRAKNCKTSVKCGICESDAHPTVFHDSNSIGVDPATDKDKTEVKSTCTQICQTSYGTSKSCAKILQVRVYHENSPHKTRMIYALIDDQSSHSLASPSFFGAFGEDGPHYQYVLVSCAGKKPNLGRRADGYIIESIDKSSSLKLPTLIECTDIPNNRNEIPSPEIAEHFPHLQDLADYIPPVDTRMDIELLIGRDLITAHHVLEQRVGHDRHPLGQKLPLGWVILGEVCMDKVHLPDTVNVNKTFVLANGRPSYFQPCENGLLVNPFQRTESDEKIGPSIEDRMFLQLMDSDFQKGNDGHWMAPLPFRKDRPHLPDNRFQAEKRARALDASLRHNPVKRKHVVEFMQKIFDRGHAEKAPSIPPDKERWYLPMFGVYHPKKPDSIRVVFDSSARHQGISLNDVLLKGPDLSNSLQGILLRFRRERVAVTADVEQMFHNFHVREDHRDFLRFLWHPNNDIDTTLEEYRMTVHVFGNSPSPAIATYGLRKSVELADSDVKCFVDRNFYVDDGLVSCSSVEEAVNLMKRTQHSLKQEGQLRLHKIASNSKFVLQQFQQDDLAKDLKSLDFGSDELPIQRSLGLSWDIEKDAFVFKVSRDQKPFTRRGVLSTINTLFDPIGFTSPVTLQGKLLLREMMAGNTNIDWDEPLQDAFRIQWESWVQSLKYLKDFQIPRMYCKYSLEHSPRLEVHVFSDASKEAIAAVAYLKVLKDDETFDIGFLLGKSKVAPTHGHTIPRLELCAAVIAVDLAEIIREQLDIDSDAFQFYTDSKVVLGYISNNTKRFHVYVANRVGRIRSFCGHEQWNYVPTECNPADLATRKLDIRDILDSMWIKGPRFLRNGESLESSQSFPLIDVDSDSEVKREVKCVKTRVEFALGSDRFSRFSTWESLLRAVKTLKDVARKYSTASTPSAETTQSTTESTETFIIKQVQQEIYLEEIHAITEGRTPPSNSSLLPLNPVLDSKGILRVGGRIRKTQVDISDPKMHEQTCHPVIIPKAHHIAVLLIRHYHECIHHQGRHLTEGAIRSSGFWIVGGKRLITSVLKQCVTCRKLRGQFGWMQMADLPPDRIEPSPLFTFVGVDTFGPWPVVSRRTRGGLSNNNRWAILFTCLVSRAVHIELVEELSSSSFINALRRFVALRGPVKQIRSDRGTNFIGAAKELNIDVDLVENRSVQNYLSSNGITWIFNPPHASHFGGAWERMIGSCRRILDAMLLGYKQDLTHEVLSTFMMEICAILNARPLLPISSDPESTEILSPSLILNQKPSSSDYEVPIFGLKDAIRSQWKRVQHLADEFWSRWRQEYLNHLQARQKWMFGGIAFKAGDVVLMKDNGLPRNQWPIGLVEEAFPSDDNKVRKVKLCISRVGKRVSYVRPISQLVRLVEMD